MYTSLVFNEVVGLDVHNQQEYKLVVDHEFLDCLGWQWSLHAMVLHIESTREEGHLVVYVVFNDKWWLCDDTAVKAMTPPPNPRKATFLLYKRKQMDLVVPDMSQSASHRTGPSALGQTRDAQSIPIDTSLPAMALAPGAPPPPPPSTQGASRVGYRNRPMHAQSVPMDSSVPAMALARGAPPPSPTATHSASRVGDRTMSMHAQSNRDEMCVAALAPLQTSSEFVEAVAQLLQKRKVRVARHLQVRVEAHQMQLRARHAKDRDERHAQHGISQTSVAQSVEEDMLRSVTFPAYGKDALCVLMQATPMQLDSGPRTLQTFVAAHWQYQFTTSGGVECVCCAWANVCGIPWVARPPQNSEVLVLGTYAAGMRMKTSGQKRRGGRCWKATWGYHVAQHQRQRICVRQGTTTD